MTILSQNKKKNLDPLIIHKLVKKNHLLNKVIIIDTVTKSNQEFNDFLFSMAYFLKKYNFITMLKLNYL